MIMGWSNNVNNVNSVSNTIDLHINNENNVAVYMTEYDSTTISDTQPPENRTIMRQVDISYYPFQLTSILFDCDIGTPKYRDVCWY